MTNEQNWRHIWTTLLYFDSYYWGSKLLLCFCSLEDEIRESIRELGCLLAKVSGGSSGNQSQQAGQRTLVQQQADTVLQPLMDFLDGRFVCILHWCLVFVILRCYLRTNIVACGSFNVWGLQTAKISGHVKASLNSTEFILSNRIKKLLYEKLLLSRI